jgi:hypothetical protein
MNVILNEIYRSVGCDVCEVDRQKVRNYIRLLASTGKTDEQLIVLGKAYLDETLKPDRRYSGC